MLYIWSIGFVLCFTGFGLTSGSSRDRRPHFWLRLILVAVAITALPVGLYVGEGVGLLPAETFATVGPVLAFAMVPGLMFVPALLYRRDGPAGPEDGDGGGPGEGGPPRPTEPPEPAGGVPLPDAAPARKRLRDHTAPRRFPAAPQRRPAHRPHRAPVRSPYPSP